MHTFRPALARGSDVFELPRPVTRLRIQDAWDFEQLKIPLAPGDTLAGPSPQGVNLTLEGQFGSHAGVTKLTESAMFELWRTLRTQLDVREEADKFEFFLYYDADSETYRKLKRCTPVRFDCDLSNPQLFEYALDLHAEDPVIYETGPGE